MGMREPGVPLFERLTSFENLYRAAKDAQRGKRFKSGVARFHHDLAASLVQLRDELIETRYTPGPYRTFTIYGPAKRFISAAPYRDRVVHHALCNVIEPLFERSFVYDSCANRALFRVCFPGRREAILSQYRPPASACPPGTANLRSARDVAGSEDYRSQQRAAAGGVLLPG